ncbi:MAG TPA: hypothetical protein VLH10_22100 [Yinghuangia sp.]|uniref:hypothetical protein n=1 Tax=Yinghuangia sp. YIM S10712 TaxID=3436930 RepID=UPI002C3EB335|nr:hypothetical protein [Yinghuangia sp.]
MKIRRSAAVAGASVLGTLALVGCNLDTKPSALVTVVYGSESEHTEAQCKDIEATEQALDACFGPASDKKPKVVKVSEGGDLGVGVEPSVSDNGWKIFVGDNAGPLIEDKTFYTGFRVPLGAFDEADSLPLRVVEYKNEQIHNVWLFSLEKK